MQGRITSAIDPSRSRWGAPLEKVRQLLEQAHEEESAALRRVIRRLVRVEECRRAGKPARVVAILERLAMQEALDALR